MSFERANPFAKPVETNFPLDFERAHPYDPEHPEKIRVIPKSAKPLPKAA